MKNLDLLFHDLLNSIHGLKLFFESPSSNLLKSAKEELELMEEIEVELVLQGSTAIEDKLQGARPGARAKRERARDSAQAAVIARARRRSHGDEHPPADLH